MASATTTIPEVMKVVFNAQSNGNRLPATGSGDAAVLAKCFAELKAGTLNPSIKEMLDVTLAGWQRSFECISADEGAGAGASVEVGGAFAHVAKQDDVSALVWLDWAPSSCYRDVFTPALLELAKNPELVVTGGAVAEAALDGRNYIADVDIFVLGSKGLEAVYSVFDDPSSVQANSCPLGTAMVRNPKYSSVPLQFVFGCLGFSREDVLRKFDFDYVMATLQTSEEGVTSLGLFPATAHAWATRVATVTHAGVRERRLVCARKKGFTLRFRTEEERAAVARSIKERSALLTQDERVVDKRELAELGRVVLAAPDLHAVEAAIAAVKTAHQSKMDEMEKWHANHFLALVQGPLESALTSISLRNRQMGRTSYDETSPVAYDYSRVAVGDTKILVQKAVAAGAFISATRKDTSFTSPAEFASFYSAFAAAALKNEDATIAVIAAAPGLKAHPEIVKCAISYFEMRKAHKGLKIHKLPKRTGADASSPPPKKGQAMTPAVPQTVSA
jgi:hypothetical protein